MLNLFSQCHELQPRRRTEEFAEKLDFVLAFGRAQFTAAIRFLFLGGAALQLTAAITDLFFSVDLRR
jgi:hypothetical protein